MKQTLRIIIPVSYTHLADGCDQHLSREEFRAKQKAFIIEQAGLSKQEAAKLDVYKRQLTKLLSKPNWNNRRKKSSVNSKKDKFLKELLKISHLTVCSSTLPE